MNEIHYKPANDAVYCGTKDGTTTTEFDKVTCPHCIQSYRNAEFARMFPNQAMRELGDDE